MNKTLSEKIPVIARAEYIEVEPNVRLHITDAGEGTSRTCPIDR